MEHHDGSPNMQPAPSYPSPSAVAVGEGAGPFFTHQQQRLSTPDDLRLTAHMSRTHAPMMSSQPGLETGLPLHHPRQAANLPQPDGQANHFQQAVSPPSNDATFAGDPNNAPRKRSKISRACDECRRKKIRCDATSDSGSEQCANCKRTNSRCQFSRVPMKRGPSKGYIKELADRLNTLENSIMPAQPPEMQYVPLDHPSHSPRATDDFSPPPVGGTDMSGQARRRTYSVSNDLSSTGYLHNLPQRPSLGGWSSNDASRHLPHPGSAFPNPQTPQSVSDMNNARSNHSQLSPNGVNQSFWKHGSTDLGRRDSISMPGESHENRIGEPNHVDSAMVEWNEKTVDLYDSSSSLSQRHATFADIVRRYYELLHPSLPLLPNSKTRLRSRLANCPPILREAFLGALDAAVRSTSRANGMMSPDFHGTRKAADLLAASQFEGHVTRNMATGLISLQTMILMAIEADGRGPSIPGGQFGPPSSVWIGAAVGLAYNLRLHHFRLHDLHPAADIDSDEKLGRRDWWVLVVLDRWHAMSTSSPVHIPDSSVSLVAEDQVLLGEIAYHLARVSCIIGHISEVYVAVDDVMSPPGPVLTSKLLRGEVERFRESVDTIIGPLGMIQMAYLHATVLVKHITPKLEPADLLGPSRHMANILSLPGTPMSPLHHHFAALTAETLVSLVDIPETKEGALLGLQTLLEAIERWGGPLAPHEEMTGWDAAIHDLIVKKQQQQQSNHHHQQQPDQAPNGKTENQGSLQHLADLAVGVGETGHKSASSSSLTNGNGNISERTPNGTPSHSSDAMALMRNGYLTMLIQDEGRQ
ncbi:MAG: Glucose-responsive transcription factor [Peltula sp. TS41687]|nr:MAG: Glucose-responsive transcription factor [Peltula sp. TS41687]